MMYLFSPDQNGLAMLMLTEDDLVPLRKGLTVFADFGQRITIGKAIVSLHKNKADIQSALKMTGFDLSKVRGEPRARAENKEGQCDTCKGIQPEAWLQKGKCITCWRELAEKLQAARN